MVISALFPIEVSAIWGIRKPADVFAPVKTLDVNRISEETSIV